MQQIWKTNWLGGMSLQAFPSSDAFAGGDVMDPNNVVRPTFLADKTESAATPVRSPAASRAELSGALEAVSRAADLIKAAEARAADAEAEMRATRDSTSEQIRRLEEQASARSEEARSQEERANVAERTLHFVIGRTEEALAKVDAEMNDFRRQAEAAAEASRASEARLLAQLEAAQARLRDADDRVFAAESRALEAKEDLAYLETTIRESFSVAREAAAFAKPTAAPTSDRGLEPVSRVARAA